MPDEDRLEGVSQRSKTNAARSLALGETSSRAFQALQGNEEKVRAALPASTKIHPDAVAHTRVESARSFEIDATVRSILEEVAAHLPRAIDAYHYVQDYAETEVTIPGLGTLKVRLHETGNGVFRGISTIEGENFKIWCCRGSGVTYADRSGRVIYNDISMPTEICIVPEDLEIHLYGDHSRVSEPEERKRASDWLEANVLKPLRETQKPEQISTPDAEIPYPEELGPLYTFMRRGEASDARELQQMEDQLLPHERKLVQPGYRLVPLGSSLEGASEIAHYGFVYCSFGQADAADDNELQVSGQSRQTGRHYGEEVVAVHPKNANDMYVVDWQPESSKPNIAKTMVPLSEYKPGQFEHPVVLIARGLDPDEVVFLEEKGEDRREES